MPKRSYPFKKKAVSASKRKKFTSYRGWNPKKSYRQKMYESRSSGCKKYYKRKPRPDLLCKGLNSGEISKDLTINNVVQMSGAIGYVDATIPQYGGFVDFKDAANKMTYILGNAKENYKVYTQLDDYSRFYVKRITTVLNNFRVTRVYRWDWMDAASTKRIYREKTEILPNCEILYFRDKFGVGYPGAMTTQSLGNWVELCERKNFKDPKEGIYWTTKFNTKGERGLGACSGLKTAMGSTSTTMTKEDLFPILGLKSKTEDKYKDIHSLNFLIGRYAPVPSGYFTDNEHNVQVKRTVKEYMQFDCTTYITLALTRAVQ